MSARRLNAFESELIARLLSPPFEGREEVAEQIESATVSEIDEDGSLAFEVTAPVAARVRKRVPTEAQVQDRDGTLIHALLHVVNGKITELEFYKEDSSRIVERPPPGEWEVQALG